MSELHPIAPVANKRVADSPVDPAFLDRWAPSSGNQ